MPTATTDNKGLFTPAYQEFAADATGWTEPINTNWEVIDSSFGGTYSPPSLTSASTDITLTATQCQNARIKLTGTATTAKTINLFFPSTLSGSFIIDNSTTGPFTIYVKNAGAGVEFVEAVQNANTQVWVDQATASIYLADSTPINAGTGINITNGDTINLTVPVTVANGGTGATTYTAGQLLIGNSAGGLTPATLTQGSNVTIVNGNGTITISATGSAPSSGVTSIAATSSASGFGLAANVSTGAVTLTYSISSTSSARTSLGLGTMATQAASSVTITGGTLAGMTTARIGTSSALSTAETVSVLAPASTNGVVSKVTTNANYNYVGQNSSGTQTFFVEGNGSVLAGNTTTGAGGPFTGARGRFNNPDEWGLEAYQSSPDDVVYGALAVRVNNIGNPLAQFFFGTGNSTAPLTNTTVGYITTDGSATTYATSSDYRLKENVSSLSDSVAAVKALRPVSYTWKNNPSLGTVSGFIAHEVQAVVPQAVSGKKDAVNPNGSIRAQGIDHSMLVPVLTATIKELIARVEALEAKLA
ncbi:Intramolecular chaperone auto-processing domain containing protein [uncultured Caudovirales phage]|uniref:Intramolecular chaperone auto-processing domain containing protein n=1 Tax=uncultured Caudovirales phage TaxID=2100421 RepID=A0A6J5N9T2_9CAUD|nr:Intramolecular chaperone auto-processing domain containing protein [uncultured Caudovirales phage]